MGNLSDGMTDDQRRAIEELRLMGYHVAIVSPQSPRFLRLNVGTLADPASRLDWFFDRIDQLMESVRLVMPHPNPLTVDAVSVVPEGDYVSDAHEFALWFLGKDE